MKRIYISIITALIFCSLITMAQEGKKEIKEVKLDLLKAPSSPASSLLGFAVSDIEKPTDLSDFMLSLQSASSSYTKLPSNYAVDLAPFYLFRKNGADFSTTGKNGLQSKKFKDYFRQSFTLSLAIRNPDSAFNNFKPTSTYGALGIKFSLIRPQYDSTAKAKLASIYKKQGDILDTYDEVLKTSKDTSSRYKELGSLNIAFIEAINNIPDKTNAEKIKLIKAMKADENSAYSKNEAEMMALVSKFSLDAQKQIAKIPELSADLQEEAKSFTGNRQGFSIDVAGGLSTEFRGKQFDNSKLFNSGVWTTFGYNWSNGNSVLGLARYLYNPDEVFALDNIKSDITDISTFDAGVRYIYSKGKFGAGAEAIYRSILSSSMVNPSWRVVANADYALATNQKLIFSFGRNFDGTITKEGNLVAALTILFGFGTSR